MELCAGRSILGGTAFDAALFSCDGQYDTRSGLPGHGRHPGLDRGAGKSEGQGNRARQPDNGFRRRKLSTAAAATTDVRHASIFFPKYNGGRSTGDRSTCLSTAAATANVRHVSICFPKYNGRRSAGDRSTCLSTTAATATALVAACAALFSPRPCAGFHRHVRLDGAAAVCRYVRSVASRFDAPAAIIDAWPAAAIDACAAANGEHEPRCCFWRRRGNRAWQWKRDVRHNAAADRFYGIRCDRCSEGNCHS